MKHILSISSLSLLLVSASANASAQIYRCVGADGKSTEYINNVKDAQIRGCKTMEGGNVTVVQGTPAQKAVVRVASNSPSPSPASSGGPEQKARDSDSRNILESELKKAEAKLAEQQKEFNNGEPEKQGIEGRNYQRYLDRVADMKSSIARNVSDIAGLKREISRLPNSN
jgi:NAD+--asparagine ADP-ribosyltransferase